MNTRREGKVRRFILSCLYYPIAFFAPLLTLAVLLNLPEQRLDVPLGYCHPDTFQQLPYVKPVTEGEWIGGFPQLAAPFQMNAYIHPMSAQFSYALAWLFGLITHSCGMALNMGWILKSMIAGLLAVWSLRRLGISPAVAMVSGLLYAVLPYNLACGTWYYNLSFHFVPVVGMMAIRMLMGTFWKLPKFEQTICWGICLLIGFDDPYQAAFCLFTLSSAWLLLLLTRAWREFAAATLAIAVILAATGLNCIPGTLATKQNPETAETLSQKFRTPEEVVERSLHVVPMLLPVPNHILKPFRQLTDEVRTQTNAWRGYDLGTFASFGVVALILSIGVLGVKRRSTEKHTIADDLRYPAVLVVFLILICISHGVSSLIAVFITSKLRFYNRVSAMIGFLGFFASAYLLERLRLRFIGNAARWRTGAYYGFLGVLLFLGVLDQKGVSEYQFVSDWRETATDFDDVKALVQQVEQHVSPEGVVLVATSGLRGSSQAFYMKPYVVSRGIRWSLGYMGGPDSYARWRYWLERKTGMHKAAVLLLVGGEGVWIDMHGEKPFIERTMSEFGNLPGAKVMDSPQGGYRFVDLSETQRIFRNEIGEAAYSKGNKAAMDMNLKGTPIWPKR